MRRHETDLVSFTAGLLFLAIGLAYLLPDVTTIEIETPWVVPTLLIGLGVCGLLSALTFRTERSRAAARLDTGIASQPESYADLEPEPYPDLTLDLAEELARVHAQRPAEPGFAPEAGFPSEPSPSEPSSSEPPEGPARPRAGGAHAINLDDPAR